MEVSRQSRLEFRPPVSSRRVEPLRTEGVLSAPYRLAKIGFDSADRRTEALRAQQSPPVVDDHRRHQRFLLALPRVGLVWRRSPTHMERIAAYALGLGCGCDVFRGVALSAAGLAMEVALAARPASFLLALYAGHLRRHVCE